jgi:hypothetical protein
MEGSPGGTVTARALVQGDDDLVDGYNCLRVGYDYDALLEAARRLLGDTATAPPSSSCLPTKRSTGGHRTAYQGSRQAAAVDAVRAPDAEGQRVHAYAAFDASGTQKGFDELVFAQRGMLIEGVQVNTNKMRMVVALKLILGKQLLLMPKGIQGIWMQLGGWRMPDTKLRQDIASCLFIAADVLNRLFVIDEASAAEEDDSEVAETSALHRRPHRRRNPRHQRQNPGRSR